MQEKSLSFSSSSNLIVCFGPLSFQWSLSGSGTLTSDLWPPCWMRRRCGVSGSGSWSAFGLVQSRCAPYHTGHDNTAIHFYMIKKLSYRDINDIVTYLLGMHWMFGRRNYLAKHRKSFFCYFRPNNFGCRTFGASLVNMSLHRYIKICKKTE